MFELSGVRYQPREHVVLDGIDLVLSERRIGVVGANGSGKSSFARLLNGLLLPTQGRVAVDGLDTRRDGRAVRRRVGFVFQNPDNQIVMPTVGEDIAFGLRNIGLAPLEREARAAAILARFGLDGLADRPSHHLSGGEKQLLALAGVLAMRPRHLVLDEPTTLLDLRNKRRIALALATLEESVILVTHDLDLVAPFERVLVFDRGRIVADGAPDGALRRYVEAMA